MPRAFPPGVNSLAQTKARAAAFHARTRHRMHPIAAFIVDEIIKRDLSRVEFFDRVGVARNCIDNWRLGRTPSLDVAQPLLHALGYKLAIVPLDPVDPVRKGD